MEKSDVGTRLDGKNDEWIRRQRFLQPTLDTIRYIVFTYLLIYMLSVLVYLSTCCLYLFTYVHVFLGSYLHLEHSIFVRIYLLFARPIGL